MIKELLLAFVLLVSTKAFAQYQIPGGGSIPMPPGCEANFGYATYCVASGFIPRGFSGDYSADALNMVRALESKYGQEQVAQCIVANDRWLRCSAYLEGQLRFGNNSCTNYWLRPGLTNTQEPVVQAELARMSAECQSGPDGQGIFPKGDTREQIYDKNKMRSSNNRQ